MNKYKILNFQNLKIDNADTTIKPFDENRFEESDLLSIVFIRDPYEYFDYYLSDCIYNEMSTKLQKETLNKMKKLSNEDFLKWFLTLNYLPLVNPQTFQLDLRKRVDTAIENLETYNYVIPYEKIHLFLKNINSEITIQKTDQAPLSFSLRDVKNNKIVEHFIQKDIMMYTKAKELWELTIDKNFKPIKTSVKRDNAKPNKNDFYGVVGQVGENSLVGWVYDKHNMNDSVLLKIYHNGDILDNIVANLMRNDIQKLKGHPTGYCGFEIIFPDKKFKKDDVIKVILPNNEALPFGKNAKAFFIS